MSTLKTTKSLGWCENVACDEFCKGVFLIKQIKPYYCMRCRQKGDMVHQKDIDEDTHNGVYKTVKVEYGFDRVNKQYTEIAVIDIPLLRVGGVYTMCIPFVSTAKRACIIGERMICALNSGDKGDYFKDEVILSFDQPREQFNQSLSVLGEKFKIRERRLYDAMREYE